MTPFCLLQNNENYIWSKLLHILPWDQLTYRNKRQEIFFLFLYVSWGRLISYTEFRLLVIIINIMCIYVAIQFLIFCNHIYSTRRISMLQPLICSGSFYFSYPHVLTPTLSSSKHRVGKSAISIAIKVQHIACLVF